MMEQTSIDDIPKSGILGRVSDSVCSIEENWIITWSISTFMELLEAQRIDTYCQNVVKIVSTNARFTASENGIICRKAPIDASV